MVLDGLDGTLRAQGVLDDGVLIPGGLFLDGLLERNGFTRKRESLGKSEGGLVPHLRFLGSVRSLLHS